MSLNLYNYVDNSPASFADPLGLFTFNLAGFLTGVAGAAGMGALVTLAIAGAFIAAPAFGALGAAILLGGCVTLAALGILSLVSAAYGAFTAKDLFTGACLDDEERSELLGGLTVGILSMLAGGAKANDINKNPGRLGKVATRIQNYLLALELQLDGWTIVGGGGMMPEEYLPGPNGARKGSNWVDITATKDGKTLRVQTVTTSDGTNPTPGELAAAAKIQAKKPGDELILIPKW